MSYDLLCEARDLYNIIKKVSEDTGYAHSYELNEFWANQNMQDMVKIINDSSNAREAIQLVQKTWMFAVNTPESVKEKAVDWHLDNLKRAGNDLFSLSHSIQESEFSNPDIIVKRQGRSFTPDFLRTINIALEITKYCLNSKSKKSKFCIVELGAGCGYLARTLRYFIPNYSYVIIDIPETLFFSYIFLKLNFPNAKVLYVTDADQLKENPIEKFDFVFVPTMFAEAITENRFDLFINTASLGEMKNSVIRYWMDFIQNKLKVKYLFTLNRYLNTIATDGSLDWRLDENECSVLYDANWEILRWELEPPFTRCPYVDTIIARYVEIVAKRDFSMSTSEKKAKSQQLVLDVMDEDWIRLERSFLPIMTDRDNILVNNMTMTGTLFKLWESIRLDHNESDVALMLKYLETLIHRHDREFEETFYYEDLFDKLFISKDNNDLVELKEVIESKRKYRTSFSQSIPSFELFIKNKYMTQFLPYLIEEGYNGFNIVLYRGKFYGMVQSLGHLDITQIEESKLKEFQESGKAAIGNSIDEVKNIIDQLVPLIPELIEEGYNGFNIVLYRGKFYGMVQSLGHLDLMQIEKNILKDYQDAGKCVIGNSVEEVKNLADKLYPQKTNISNKDEIIRKLGADISERDGTIRNLNADLVEKNERMKALHADISERDETIRRLSEDISERDMNINALQKELTKIKSTRLFSIGEMIKRIRGYEQR